MKTNLNLTFQRRSARRSGNISDGTSNMIAGSAFCKEWTIDRDYLTSDKSQFKIDTPSFTLNQGDFVVARAEGGKLMKAPGVTNRSHKDLVEVQVTTVYPLYVGIVESIEYTSGTVVNTRDWYNLLDFDIVATSKTGSDINGHLGIMFNTYFLDGLLWGGADSGNINFVRKQYANPTKIPWSYQPSDPPTITNLRDYFINAFKKYGVVLDIDFVYHGDQVGWPNSLIFDPIIYNSTDLKFTLNLKNNSEDFANWSVYYAPRNADVANVCAIYDKSRVPDMESNAFPSYVYYLQKDGSITNLYNEDLVEHPVKQKGVIYDFTDSTTPKPLEIAQAKLAMPSYNHEISVDVKLDSKLIKFTDLRIGSLANIFYGTDLYPSVLTGYTLSSDSTWVTLKFGNVRSTLQSILDSL